MSTAIPPLETVVFETPLGVFGTAIRVSTVLRIVIGQPSNEAARTVLSQAFTDAPREWARRENPSGTLTQLRDALTDYTLGKRVDFSIFPLDFEHLTPYQKRVTEVVRSIPYGETLSYAQVAELAGSPRAARAVGNVMAHNRFPILVPCHRVLAASGKIGGFSAPGGISFKQRLLDLESSGK